jgi:hypothetical protein
MLPARITLAHFSVCSAMSLPKSSGERKRRRAQVGEPRFHLRVGERRIDFHVELLDDPGRRVLGRAETGPEARLVARQELAFA